MTHFSVHSRDPETDEIPQHIVVIEGIKAIDDIETFQALLKYCELPPEATLIANDSDVMAVLGAPPTITGCRVIVDGDIPMLLAHGTDCPVSTGILESVGGISGIMGEAGISEDVTITFDPCPNMEAGAIEAIEIPTPSTTDDEGHPSETGL